MTKSDLIDILADKNRHLSIVDVKSAVDVILEHKTQSSPVVKE